MHDINRIIILVLDSLGIGSSADAEQFGDAGADTLGHIAKVFDMRKGLNLHNLYELGLAHAYHISTAQFPAGITPPRELIGSYACAKEISSGKDTPSGHWEMTGVPVLWDWGYFPDKEDSFPDDLLKKIINRSGIPGYLGNCHASGTEIIARLGEEHIKTGKPIFYTSADSVFQIACHEQHFGLENLYRLCEYCRELLTPLNIGRVIARPFTGTCKDTFKRTGNRHDYAISPPSPTVLEKLISDGGKVTGIGKIGDIFAHTGMTKEIRASGHPALWCETLAVMDQPAQSEDPRSIIITNFVDFDALYGHRRDIIGYGEALEEFDRHLPMLYAKMNPDDLLILTADHGNDPSWHGTDHTREHVPILLYQQNAPSINHGFRESFADIAQTIAKTFNLSPFEHGKPLDL